MQIKEAGKYYEVQFNYSATKVADVKKIPGVRWEPLRKIWLVPAHEKANIDKLKKKYKIGTDTVPEMVGPIDPLPDLHAYIPLLRELYPYQKNGVAYGMLHKRIIVGDEPGLGKTGQAIAMTEGVKAKCILVICPATLRENWKREYKIWTGRQAMIMTDKIKESWFKYNRDANVKMFICNYESLKKYFVEKIEKHVDKEGREMPLRLNHIIFKSFINLFDFIIVDESHRCKDNSTLQSKLVKGICVGKEYVCALTGTPVVNKPKDIIPQLSIINQLEKFGGYKRFVDRYCNGPNESSNLKELNFLMHKNCFYRREKKMVLKDLPDKMRNIVRCDIDNRKEYQKAEDNFRAYLKSKGFSPEKIDNSLRAEVLTQMMMLKRISAEGKIPEVLEHIQEVIEAGEKIVVFAHHKEIVLRLKKELPGAVTIVGDDSMQERQTAVDAFQNKSSVQVIICNIKSGGVGITLTASSRVAFIELPWHAADCDQCEDRCHRIGQKSSVQCTYFLGHDTIDDYIYQIIESKRKIANQVTGAEDTIQTNMVDQFLSLFSK